MDWKECIDKGIIIKTEPDNERSDQMVRMADLRLEFWEEDTESKFAALKVEAYYDVIKELIFAHLYKKGYNCTNHLCLIAYLEENFENIEFEIHKIDELRKVRNEINYRGMNVQQDYLARNELEFKNIIKKLKEEISVVS